MLALLKCFCDFSGEHPTETSDDSLLNAHDACPLTAASWVALRPGVSNILYTDLLAGGWGAGRVFPLPGSLLPHDPF